MIDSLQGRTCASVRRVQHRLRGQPHGEPGALELDWGGGEYTTLDVNADWTLDVAFRSWTDPFADASVEERQRLSGDVGLWDTAEPGDDLLALVGRTVTAVQPLLNEVGELTGLEISFAETRVVARVESGGLEVRVVS
jgi:hypothetical protein